VSKRNVTLQLDEEILRRARLLAAERATSVSRLVAEQLEKLVADDAAYDAARRRARRALGNGGYHTGGQPLPHREVLHER
jgi:hypothetical protein